MLTPKEQQEQIILDAIQSSPTPLGAGALSQMLARKGFDVSEATIGRFLRGLEGQALLEKQGVRGRVLTSSGNNRLRELEIKSERNESAQTFLETLQGPDEQRIIDILIARRAIERETARFAALRATAEDIRAFKDILSLQEKQIRAGSDISGIDTLFHNLIARTSRNIVLEAAVDLIRQETDLAPAFAGIRKHMQNRSVQDHIRIYEAIASHLPEEAEKAMIDHLDQIIREAQSFLEQR